MFSVFRGIKRKHWGNNENNSSFNSWKNYDENKMQIVNLNKFLLEKSVSHVIRNDDANFKLKTLMVSPLLNVLGNNCNSFVSNFVKY